MKKITLRNLVALTALVLGTTQVMADVVETTVVNCDFENSETLFGNDSRITVANVNDGTLNSNVLSFTTANNSMNGYSLSTYNFSNDIGDDATSVKVEFDFKIASGTAAYYRYFTLGQADLRTGFGKQAYSTSGAIFGFGLSRQSSANYFSINGAKTTAEANASNVIAAWAHVSVLIDLSNKVVSYAITSLDGNTTYYSADGVAFYNADPSQCNQIDFFDCANSVASYMDNLVITKYVDQSKVSTTYTVKYQNADGVDLKDPVIYNTYVGDTYTATEADMVTFYSADASQKYVYASGNESKKATETASDNVITLVFNEYEKVAYTVTAQNGEDDLQTIASGEAYTDGSTTAYWSKYIQVNSQWYETTAPYGIVIEEAGNINVAYTESDITYFVEAENISKSRSAAANAVGDRYSGGEAQRHYASSQWWTASFSEGGVYNLTFSYSMANASASTLVIKTRDADGNFTETETSLTANTPGTFSEDINVPAGCSIAICNDAAYNSNILIDYVAVKLVLPTTITATIAECGYATLCSEYALDFTENDDVKAYIVEDQEVSDKVVTTEVTKVPAGAGIILKGEVGSCTINTTTEEVEELTNNMMVGVLVDTNLDENCGYILYTDGLFHPCGGGTLAAGKAYLGITPPASQAGAKPLTIVFEVEGTATAVKNVETNVSDESIYTLSGTRLNGQPTQHGVYIIGGKKVVK